MNSDGRVRPVSREETYDVNFGSRGGGKRQPRAFVSVVLKARDLHRQLQISMRKPLKWLTYSLGYDSGTAPLDGSGCAGTGFDIAVSKARLYSVRMAQRREKVDSDGAKWRVYTRAAGGVVMRTCDWREGWVRRLAMAS